MALFQGHGIIAILADICWPFIWLFLLYSFNLPKVGRGMKLGDWLYLYLLLVLTPNAMYAFFEIKHLIFADGIADAMNFWSYLIFGGVSLFGAISAIVGTRKIVNHYAHGRISRSIWLLILSLAMGLGGAIGLLDFASPVAIVFPPVLIYISLVLFSHPFYLHLGLLASASFFVISILFDFILKPT